MAGGKGEGESLEFTPTWVVAVVCTIIVGISYIFERGLHVIGKKLSKAGRKPLYEALQKIKEELLLLGFISLLLAVFQYRIVKFCVKESIMKHFLPCSLKDKKQKKTVGDYCASRNQVPLLSVDALHHLHIFIFVLAVVHVIFSLLTFVVARLQIRQWKHWEEAITKVNFDHSEVLQRKVTNVRDHDFIRSRFKGFGKRSTIRGWLHSFFKQIYRSVTKTDYLVLRLGFITTHCKSNPNFNFQKYMIRVLEDDFKKVVGIRWYLWVYVVFFLLLNVNGWHVYFFTALVPFILLLAVGTKLEHIIIQLAHEVAEKHTAIEGDLVVQPSDDHFWFRRPKLVLYFIHFILFQNAFEFAFMFFILVQYGLDSCIRRDPGYIIARLIIGAFIQILFSYSTLPLYALVAQMGTNYKQSIFDERIQAKVTDWALNAKKKAHNAETSGLGHDGSTIATAPVAPTATTDDPISASMGIQLAENNQNQQS